MCVTVYTCMYCVCVCVSVFVCMCAACVWVCERDYFLLCLLSLSASLFLKTDNIKRQTDPLVTVGVDGRGGCVCVCVCVCVCACVCESVFRECLTDLIQLFSSTSSTSSAAACFYEYWMKRGTTQHYSAQLFTAGL